MSIWKAVVLRGGMLFLFALSLNGAPSQAQDLLQPPPIQPLVGAYYFGIFSNQMVSNGKITPLSGQTYTYPWWAGIEDFFLKRGPAYQYFSQINPAANFSHLRPSIGYYDMASVSSNPMVQHIDQAHRAGLDYFNFYWYWSASRKAENYDDGVKAFYRVNQSKMKYMITIYSHYWDADLKISDADMNLAAARMYDHFASPNYLKVNGRHVIAIGDGRGIGDGKDTGVIKFINAIRAIATANGYPQPQILIGRDSVTPRLSDNGDTQTLFDYRTISNSDGYSCLIPAYSAVTASSDYQKFVNEVVLYHDGFPSNRPVAPCLASGFDERPRYLVMNPNPYQIRYFSDPPANQPLLRADQFSAGLNSIFNWQTTHMHPISQMVNLYAWNEWHEGGILEPNQRDGTLLLDRVLKTFRTIHLKRYANPNGHRVTTLQLPSSWIVEGAGYRLFTESRAQVDRAPLYECTMSSTSYFLSRDVNCEGKTKIGLLGYVATSATAHKGLLPLYRCRVKSNSDYFVSSDVSCENSALIVNEGLLGYAL